MNNGREGRRGPGSVIVGIGEWQGAIEAVVFGLSRCLAAGNEADFQA
jgi:hypothetical protein